MTAPSLPPLGDKSWRDDWGQWVHDQVAKVAAKLGVADLSATGTRSSSTFLRGDNTWATPPAGGTVSDATTSAKGIVQLAGDLAGTAAAPTVPGLSTKVNTSTYTSGLAGKADTSHTHPVADLTATGTRNSSTVLHGDNTWKTPAAGGLSAGVTLRAIWNGSAYVDRSDSTTITSSTDRPTGTYFVFLGGPDPDALGLMVDGDEWKDAVA